MKFVHCADLHLDTAFSGLGDSRRAAVRQAELRSTFLAIVERAKEADVLLIAGDLFDQESIEAETLHILRRGFASLGDIPVLIAAGNHDPLTAQSYYRLAAFSPNVHVFGTEPERICVAGCDIYGVSFCRGDMQEALLTDFRPEPGRPSVLLMHGELGGGSYNPVSRELIAASGLSYLALGHRHTYEETTLGKTLCVYPGCPEGRGFDELDEKGIVAGEVTEQGVSAVFVPLCRRRHRELTVDITGLLSHDEVAERVRAAGIAETDLYKVKLAGETELVPDVGVLAQAFDDCFYIKFYDETVRPLDIEALKQEPGIRGLFAEALYGALPKGSETLYRRALEYGLSALRGEKVKWQ